MDSTESRIPRDSISAAKPLCLRLPRLRQLELLVFGPHPAGEGGEGGAASNASLTVWRAGYKNSTARRRHAWLCVMPLGREVRSEWGIMMCALTLTIDTAS
jgi:hypothetical protein